MQFQPMRRPDSSDDRHVMHKHQGIYPNEAEVLTLSTLSNFNELFYALFWRQLKQSVGVKWLNNITYRT